MKYVSVLTIALLLSSSLFAQKEKDIPAFGKIDKSDLEMKDCDFDKNAEAVVLFDVAESYCNLNMYSSLSPITMKTERRAHKNSD